MPGSLPFWGSPYAEPRTTDADGLPNGVSPWEYLLVEGKKLPGIIRIRRCLRVRAVDKKKPPGQDGSRLTFLGVDPSEVDMSLEMWLPKQWQLWQERSAILQPPPNKGHPKALQVSHPALSSIGITSLYILHFSPPVPRNDGSDIAVVDLLWTEFLPPQPKDVTNTPTTAGTIGPHANVFTPPESDPTASPAATEASNPNQSPPFTPAGHVGGAGGDW